MEQKGFLINGKKIEFQATMENHEERTFPWRWLQKFRSTWEKKLGEVMLRAGQLGSRSQEQVKRRSMDKNCLRMFKAGIPRTGDEFKIHGRYHRIGRPWRTMLLQEKLPQTSMRRRSETRVSGQSVKDLEKKKFQSSVLDQKCRINNNINTIKQFCNWLPF